jgi:putative hydrolase of the HAD superfamily
MNRFVLVDFDDTLVETGPRFRSRRDELFSFLESLGFPRTLSYRVHHEIVDPELMGIWGYGPFRLGASFRDTYLRLCVEEGQSPNPKDAQQAEALADGIDSPPPPIPGALDGLARLASAHPVAIYTQSSFPDYQTRCVESSGVLDIIPRDRLIITPVKSVGSYRRALTTLGAGEPGESCMIGNSMRSDVNPALKAGARAIWIDSGDPWHADLAEPFHDEIPRADSFSEAVEMLVPTGSSAKAQSPFWDSAPA